MRASALDHDDVMPGAVQTTVPRGMVVWLHDHIGLQHASFGIVILLSAFLNFVALGSEGYANTYYAAAVKSMSQNWHNFFFVAFDPGGFVSVDKPPLGLWLQVASAKLFGFSGVSLLIPQGIAAVLSVAVLYGLITRHFGHGAGLLASLSLALTPVAVVDNRNNTSDSVLILFLLLSAWGVSRAVESGRLRWLFLGAALVGLAFNVKEMEAFLVLPPLALLYLVGGRRTRLVRLGHLLLAGFVTLIVSFSWIIAVDLTPASGRPYVSDSGTNSELSLALGYNGLGRLATGLLGHLPSIPILHVKIDGSIVPGISMDIGNPGLLRLFRPAIGGQASWLLLIALVGLTVAFLLPHSRFSLRRERAALLFWGAWLLAAGLFFSVARFYHLYYLILLAPPVSALTGIGLSRLWSEYRDAVMAVRPRPWQGWLLPATILAAGWTQAHILGGYATWNAWLGPAIIVSSLLIAAALVLGRLGLRLALAPDFVVRFDARTMLAATLLGVASLLAAPTAFAAESVANGNGAAWLPQAGPSTGFGMGGPGGGGPGGLQAGGPPTAASGFGPPTGATVAQPTAAGRSQRPATGVLGGGGGGPGGGGGAITFAGSTTPTLDSGLVTYLEKHRSGARYLVATATSSYASLFILKTGQPVMALGGYQGWDKILTLAQLKRLVANGTIRFFLLSGSSSSRSTGGPGGGTLPGGVDAGLSSVNDNLTHWVTSSCSTVPTSTYATTSRKSSVASTGGPGGSFGAQGAGQLYDCSSIK
jgi:4-amino-4-deoxy-L-arabinose transferase-like glycosyltransferase